MEKVDIRKSVLRSVAWILAVCLFSGFFSWLGITLLNKSGVFVKFAGFSVLLMALITFFIVVDYQYYRIKWAIKKTDQQKKEEEIN